MRTSLAIVYNEPHYSRYNTLGEEKAAYGVLEAVDAVHQALSETGYNVVLVPLMPPLKQVKRKLLSINAALVFNLFEGFCGCPETEAAVPEILSELGLPYTGCPGSLLRLALDKAKVKVILKTAGIPTPNFTLLNPQTLHMLQLDYPCIVKPRCEDASHGLTIESVVSNFASLAKQVTAISGSYGGAALVEEFIDGREFNATILGNSEYIVLPVSEIVYSLLPGMPRVLTFAAKWETDSPYFQGTRAVCPANIGDTERQHIMETAVTAFRLLGGKGYARIDMRMDELGQVNVIEVNPNPDISPGSGAIRQAEVAGMTYAHFIDRIVQMALGQKGNENQNPLYDSSGQTEYNNNTTPYARVQSLRSGSC